MKRYRDLGPTQAQEIMLQSNYFAAMMVQYGQADGLVTGASETKSSTLRPLIQLIKPLGYLDFMNLYSGAKLVLTDSGGLQEETTALGIPCLTLRENTERPITIEMGTNILVGTNPNKITQTAYEILDGKNQTHSAKIPPLWDGKTAERICHVIIENS